MSLDRTADAQRIAEAVRQACAETLLAAYEGARMDGLCHEGAWEIALNALQTMKLDPILQRVNATRQE